MEYTRTTNGSVYNLKLSGRFTFADHNAFKEIFKLFTDSSINKIEIDLSNVEFVDSAALGMLLLTRDEAKKASKAITIRNPQGQVKKMFEISRFYELFDIL
jgi:anti-anti-sigma factor